MNWLIGFDGNNVHRLGSDYTRKTNYRTFNSWTKEAKMMQKAQPTIQKVFVISEGQYTQKVCEMGLDEFAKYIQKVGARVL